MNFLLQPWQLLVVILTGWLNRKQQAVIDFLLTEVHVLKGAYGGKCIRLSDDKRRRLAITGKALGRKALQETATIVMPDTILRWHRQLVAAKGNYSGYGTTALSELFSTTPVPWMPACIPVDRQAASAMNLRAVTGDSASPARRVENAEVEIPTVDRLRVLSQG